MKVKFRVDLKAIKEGFFLHVEKVAFIVVVLCFFLFVYSAGKGNSVMPDFTADQLKEIVGRADKHLAEGKPPEKFGKGVDYEAEARRIREATAATPYQYEFCWDPSLFSLPRPRVPQVYSVTSLRGTAGYGAMAQRVKASEATMPGMAMPGMAMPGMAMPGMAMPGMAAPQAGPRGGAGLGMAGPGMPGPGMAGPAARPGAPGAANVPILVPQVVGQRWVVLTGLIDYAKQVEAYRTAFSGTIVSRAFATTSPGQATTVLPEYRVAVVQRVECSESGEIDPTKKWDWIKVLDQMETINTSAQLAGSVRGVGPTLAVPEVIDLSFHSFSPYVTFRLPVVRDHRWGPEVVHAPEVPMQTDLYEKLLAQQQEQLAAEEAALEKQEKSKPVDPDLPPDIGAFSSPPGTPGAPGAPGQPGMPGMLGQPGGPVPGGNGGGGFGMFKNPSNDDDDSGGGAMLGPMGPTGPTGLAGLPALQPGPIRLFRFFDFTVEPGKHYRYKVMLLLTNPAQRVPKALQSLLPPELEATKTWLKSDYSEPSEVVSIPADTRLLARSVKPQRLGDPTANLLLVRFDARDGSESTLETNDVVRGQLVNYFQLVEVPRVDPNLLNPNVPAATPRPGPRPAGNQRPEMQKTDFATESLLLDMQGGDKLARSKLSRSASLLFLDSTGNLVVRDELEDQQNVERFKPPEATAGAAPPKPVRPPSARMRRMRNNNNDD